jgi:two-component system response regulator AlgR
MEVRSIEIDDIHVVLCLKFDHRAPSGEVDAFKRSLMLSEDVCHCIETSGAFDFMVEFALPDFQSYTARIKQLSDPLARLVERYDANFVARRFVPHQERMEDLWIPNRDGFERISCDRIDTVRAEGDYVRIHSGDRSWLMNITMAAMVERLDPRSFIRLHRSAIVRRDFIERLKYRNGRWEALLSDGSTQRVARSHVMATLRTIRGDAAMNSGRTGTDLTATDDHEHFEDFRSAVRPGPEMAGLSS